MHTILAFGLGNMSHFSSATGGLSRLHWLALRRLFKEHSVLLCQDNTQMTTMFTVTHLRDMLAAPAVASNGHMSQACCEQDALEDAELSRQVDAG